MKRVLLSSCVLFYVFALCTSDILAQVSKLKSTASRKRSSSAGKKDAPPVEIDKLYGIGNRAKFDTPTYNTSAARGINTPKKWSRIQVLYKTARSDKAWLDSLTFSYYALSKRVDKERGTLYTFYKKNVHYVNIETGRKPLNHRSTVFFRPATIKRNGDLVAVAVELSVNGVIVDMAVEYATGASGKLPKSEKGQWWKNSVITENKITTLDTSSILDRAHSPWAFINMDDYEVIK